MYKQIIIARKDLNMSPGKLAAQVSHGSMAFLTSLIRKNSYQESTNKCCTAIKPNGEQMLYKRRDLTQWAIEAYNRGESKFYIKPVDPSKPHGLLELCDPDYVYATKLKFDVDLYEQWLNGSFTKCVLKAKNKNQLLKAKTMAEELGMEEGKDFFCIYDECRTELEPEDYDENGIGRTLTVIGFRPMASEVIDKIGKKYQLYM